MMLFCQRLKQIRIEKQISSKKMAESIGVAASTYCQYETGKREPDVFKIKEISRILEVSTDYLIFGEDSVLENPYNITDKYEKSLINNYRALSDLGKSKAQEYISDLAENPKYKK